jgi:hypothetical protein
MSELFAFLATLIAGVLQKVERSLISLSYGVVFLCQLVSISYNDSFLVVRLFF